MTLTYPAGFGSAAFIFTGNAGTQPFVTTIGVDIFTSGATEVEAANNLFIAYKTHLLPVTRTSFTLDRVTLSIGPMPGSGSVDSTEAPSAGSFSTGTPVPGSMAAIARKTTNRLGRKGRGRMYLPGVLNTGDVTEDGSISVTRRNIINTALSGFVGALNTNDLAPVLLHSDGSAPDPIVNLTVSDLVGWVRGRIR